MILPPFIRRRLPSDLPIWRPIVMNVGWLLVDKVARAAIGLTVGVWTARYLGPGEYGALNFAQSFVMLFGCVATLGIDYIGVRDLVRQPEDRACILGTLFWLRLATGVVLTVASTICALVQGVDASRGLAAIISLVLLMSTGEVFDLWFQAELQARRATIARSAAFLTAAAIRVALIVGGAPVAAFAWLLVAESAFISTALLVSYLGAGGRMKAWHFSTTRAKTLLVESWPNIISNMAIVGYMRIDRIMLGAMLGESAVGVYSAASNLVDIWYVLPMAAVASATPMITRSHQENPGGYVRQVAQLARLLAAVAWALVAVLHLAAWLVVPWLYGEAYAGSGRVLGILAWGLPFGFLGVAVSPWYLNEGFFVVAMWRHLAGAAVNFGLNLLLIPPYGAAGAALATVIAYGVAHVFANAIIASTRPVFNIQLRASLLLPDKVDHL